MCVNVGACMTEQYSKSLVLLLKDGLILGWSALRAIPRLKSVAVVGLHLDLCTAGISNTADHGYSLLRPFRLSLDLGWKVMHISETCQHQN